MHAFHAIAATQVDHILQGARHRGHNIDCIFKRAGIDRAQLSAPSNGISLDQMAALMRVLTRTMRDETWGLCEVPVRPGTFATACRAMVDAKSLGESLAMAVRFYRITMGDFAPRLRVEDGVATVELINRSHWHDRRGYAESTFLFMGYNLLCWLTGRRLTVRNVQLRRERIVSPMAGHDASWLFEAPTAFSCDRTTLSFDAELLELPIVQNATDLSMFLHEAPARLMIKYRDRTSVAQRVRRILSKHMEKGPLSLEDTAEKVAMAPQTLRKKLSSEGVNFQALKDELRCDLSIEHLTRPDYALIDVATRVGFADASTFSRAFKAWTGHTPSEYRHAQLARLG
jgi:AraC-like DNA-binding protein